MNEWSLTYDHTPHSSPHLDVKIGTGDKALGVTQQLNISVPSRHESNTPRCLFSIKETANKAPAAWAACGPCATHVITCNVSNIYLALSLSTKFLTSVSSVWDVASAVSFHFKAFSFSMSFIFCSSSLALSFNSVPTFSKCSVRSVWLLYSCSACRRFSLRDEVWKKACLFFQTFLRRCPRGPSLKKQLSRRLTDVEWQNISRQTEALMVPKVRLQRWSLSSLCRQNINFWVIFFPFPSTVRCYIFIEYYFRKIWKTIFHSICGIVTF